MRRGRYGLLLIAYLVIGVLVAASKDYLDIENVRDLISAALGIVLWPLLLFGVNLHVGKLDDDGGRRRESLLMPALFQISYSLKRLWTKLL